MDNDGTNQGYNYQQYDRHIIRKETRHMERQIEELANLDTTITNKNTALTNHSTLRHSKTIQILNGKQARRSLFLSEQPDRYMAESADNQDKYILIKKENNRGIPVQNIFDAPTKGILLPWNLQMSWKKENNLLFETSITYKI